jgi:hypothetical protein
MCVSLVAAGSWLAANAGTAAAIGSAVGTVGGLYQADKARKDAKKAAGAQDRSDAEAAQSSNARLAQRRRALSSQSLLTGGGDLSSGVLGGGKPTLGG